MADEDTEVTTEEQTPETEEQEAPAHERGIDPIDDINETLGDQPEQEAPPPEKPEPDPDAKQKFTLKVDGQESEVELTRDEIAKQLQMAASSNKRFQEAKQIQKQATDFILLLQTEPLKLLTNPKLGIDFDKLSQDYLYEKFQLSQMTPEQKEAYEVKRELEELTNQNKAEKEAREAEDIQRQTEMYTKRYNTEYLEALAIANLPDSPFIRNHTFRALDQAFAVAKQRGEELPESFGPKDILPFVLEDYRNGMRDLMGTEGSKALDALLPAKPTPKSPTTPVKKTTDIPAQRKPTGKKRWVSPADFIDQELYG